MRDDGKAIIIITHKLNEVLAISDRVNILRKGECVGELRTKDATIQTLTENMVGRAINLEIKREEQSFGEDRILVSGLTCINAEGRKVLDDVSFSLRAGEILGVAGIAGSGQKELCEALTGLHPIECGSITYIETGNRKDITGLSPTDLMKNGLRVAFVPEDRLGMGLVAGLDIVENMMLKSYSTKRGFFADRKTPKKEAERLISVLDIVAPNVLTPVRRLSGGNVQKVLLGREIESNPSVLVAAYPVRGLDINSSYTIYNLLNAQRKSGVAVLYIGEDLDVLLELCDRIVVLCGGRLSGSVDARNTTKEELGLMMTHI
jgi:simple sugar transport system ATP-binding protein